MARLNIERQQELEPKRIDYAVKELENIGVEIMQRTNTEIQFLHKGKVVKFFPYSGWASGATIKDGRGIKRLIKQLK